MKSWINTGYQHEQDWVEDLSAFNPLKWQSFPMVMYEADEWLTFN